VEFEFCVDLYSETYVETIWHTLCTVITEICRRPDLALRELELVTVGVDSGPGGLDAALTPVPATPMHEQFAARARANPALRT